MLNGSKVLYNDAFVIIKGKQDVTVEENQPLDWTFEVNYPSGFSKDYCIVLAFATRYLNTNTKGYSFGVRATEDLSGALVETAFGKAITLLSDKMTAHFYYSYAGTSHSKTNYSIEYEIVLMKLPTYTERIDYKLGDVDLNGQIEENDGDVVLQYDVGKIGLTEQQLKAADVNKDGNVNPHDALMIKKYAAGQISSFEE